MKSLLKYLLTGFAFFCAIFASCTPEDTPVEHVIKVDPVSIETSFEEDIIDVKVEANCTWTVDKAGVDGDRADWITYGLVKAEGNADFQLKIAKNTSGDSRTAKVIVKSDQKSVEISVVQEGDPDYVPPQPEPDPDQPVEGDLVLEFDFSESAGLNWPSERKDDWSKTCVTLDSGRAQDNGGTATDNPHSRATFAYNLNGTEYLFTFVDPDNMPESVTHNIRYAAAKDGTWGVIIGTWRQLGLPSVKGFRLIQVIMKQGAPTEAEGTRKVGIGTNVVEMTSDKKVDITKYTYAAGGELINQDVQGVSHSFNLTGTDDQTMYYINTPTSSTVVCSLTLVYDKIQ